MQNIQIYITEKKSEQAKRPRITPTTTSWKPFNPQNEKGKVSAKEKKQKRSCVMKKKTPKNPSVLEVLDTLALI